jgi:tetratricopeptide (TPR) repeat protein
VSDSLYEQYKDALRRGHVAALRGRPDEALVAYRQAAELAPERPLPHASQGTVLLRAGQIEEALAAYDEALRRAPEDEGALSGRADVLARAGRRIEAAEALDQLAAIQQAAGRLAEACETAGRALEQAESRARRRQVEALARELQATGADQAAEQALARALRTLEGPDISGTTLRPREGAEVETGAGYIAPAEPEPEPEPVPDVVVVMAEAEGALEAGDFETARERLLVGARVYGGAGRHAAALDACYQALAIAPSDPNVHLALVELYLARGWRAPAADKLALLSRLVDLQADQAAHDRLCEIVAERFPNDPRLTAICA